MKRFIGKDYALDIHTGSYTHRISTSRIEMNGFMYTASVLSVEESTSRIDPVSFSASITEVKFTLSKLDIEIRDLYRVKIYEITYPTYEPRIDGDKVKIGTELPERKITSYTAKDIETLRVGEGYELTITFSRDEFFNKNSLQKLDRNTFSRYLTISPTVVDTEVYVPISDLSEDSATPFGPIIDFVQLGAKRNSVGMYIPIDVPKSRWGIEEAHRKIRISPEFMEVAKEGALGVSSFWVVGGENLDKDMIFKIRVSKKHVDAFIFNSNNSTNAKDFYAGQTFYNSKRSVPLGKVIKIKETGVDTDSYRSIVTFEAEPESYLLMYKVTPPKDLIKAINKEIVEKGGTIPVETEEEALRQFVASEAGNGKIFPYAWEYKNFKLVTEGRKVVKTVDTKMVLSPTGNQWQMEEVPTLEIEMDVYDEFYEFDLIKAVDLRSIHAFRLGNPSGTNDETNDGRPKAYSEESMFLQSYSQMGTLEDRIKLFDEDFIKEELKGGVVELAHEKWFVAGVRGVRTIKSVSVDTSVIQEYAESDLTSLRVDSVSSDDQKNNNLRILKTDGEVEDVNYGFESIFEVVDGRFAFIQAIGPDPKNRTRSLIVFHTTRQWQNDMAQPSFPNGLTLSGSHWGDIKNLIIVVNPLPENSPAEGEIIPICYGYMKKFPALQAISNKSNFGDATSAGDDLYVLCTNSLARRDSNGVTVYWSLDEFASGAGKLSGPSTEISTFQSGLDKAKEFWLPNPFPTVGKVPVKFQVEGIIDQIAGMEQRHLLPNPVLEYEIRPHPLHQLIEIEDNKGFRHSAIRLRGDEYLPEVGDADMRHGIRFGLGSSKIHCSFVGTPDDDVGSITGIPRAPLTNPAHILHHFIKTYSIEQGSDFTIDEDSFQYAFSKTSKLNASFYISSDEIEIEKSLIDLSKCSFVFPVFLKGVYKAKYFSLDTDQTADVKIDESDIYSVETEPFFEGVTEYTFKYGFDFPTDKYMESIKIGVNSSPLIAEAVKKSGAGSASEIEFQYLFDEGTVRRLIPKYIDLMSGYRSKIAITVPNGTRLFGEVEICDIIEVTAGDVFDYAQEQMGFNREKFIVYEVTPGNSEISIKAIQLRNSLNKKANIIFQNDLD